ncbi:MAG TPA: mechanosensitive ion channel family protein [Flavitalea sp.]|nr:mechanosensitive ion channel family protein [Flavitalea sp.]
MILLQATETTVAIEKSAIWLDKLADMAVSYAPKILGAILVYIIGSWIIRSLVRMLGKSLNQRKFDASLQKFLLSLTSATLSILLFLAIAGMIGVDITSFAALLAGAGIAIGAALNGSLGNLAGGVMIMIFKPFKVSDMIEAQGIIGVVTEIGIFCTTVLTEDNKTVFLPNGALSTGVITNYTTHGNLRVDLTIAIDAGANIDQARDVAIKAMRSHPKVLESPAPSVNVSSLADGITTLTLCPFTTQTDYWDVYFGVQERVKKAFDENKVAAPMPTSVVYNRQG